MKVIFASFNGRYITISSRWKTASFYFYFISTLTNNCFKCLNVICRLRVERNFENNDHMLGIVDGIRKLANQTRLPKTAVCRILHDYYIYFIFKKSKLSNLMVWNEALILKRVSTTSSGWSWSCWPPFLYQMSPDSGFFNNIPFGLDWLDTMVVVYLFPHRLSGRSIYVF